MKIPYLSGLKVSGEVEFKNLKEQVGATKYLTIDVNNNVTWSNGGGGSGSVDLSAYFTKIQSDARYQPIGNYLTSVQWSDVINKPTLFDGNYNSLTNKPLIPSLTSQLTNDSGFVTASIVNGYATENWVLNKNYLTSEVDTLDSVLGRGNSSGKNINVSGIAKFDGQLIIPSSASNQNQSIWLGNAGSTGNTAPMISFLNDLGDVTIGSVSNGQALVYENGIWINKSVVTDLSNYYTIAASNTRFKPLNYVPTWDEVTGKPSIPSTAGLASITYVDNKVADLVNQAPSTLDTLNELASALGNDPNFSTTVLNQIGTKANISDVYNKATADSKFQEKENQRLSTGNDVLFSKIKAVNELVIPSNASGTNLSIWLGESGIGNGGGNPSIVSYLKDLQDVSFSNLANGESLVYDNGIWVNKKFALAGDYVLQSQLYNYYTKTQNDSKYKDINWLPTWNQVTAKPTNLSQFTNDLGNYGGFLLSDGATYAGFAGNNVLNPYMRHTTTNEVVYLARKAELGSLAYENKVYRHYSIDNHQYYIKHSWDGTGWNLRAENDVADEQANIHLVNINGKSENSTAWNGQRYTSTELTTASTWLLGYDANTGQWKPTGKNVINSFLGLGSAAFKDENSWLKPSNNPNTAANYNFAIGTDGTRNFIQSHSGLELQINPLGNKVVLNNATVLNDLVIPATPSGANQSIWLGAAGSNSNNPSTNITTLASLQDVDFTNLTSGQSISYNSSTGKWNNVSYQISGNYALNDGSNIITTSFRANLGLGSLAYRNEEPRADVAGWSLAQRNSAGDLYARYYNMQAGSPDEAPIANFVYTDGEGFLRKSSAGALSGWLGLNVGGSFHRFNTFYADANTVPEHTSNFSYANNAPWNGYLGHFGANGYGLQLSGQYGDGRKLSMRLRNGDAAAWNPWFQIYHSGDTNQVKSDLGLGALAYRNELYGGEIYSHISRADWDVEVTKYLRWKNYGNSHIIFDASNGTAPNGAAIDKTNPQYGWSPLLPNLMGWNGNATYAVRVDSSRYSESSVIAERLKSYNGSNGINWGWDGSGITFKVDNSDFGATVPMSIGGSARSWGGAVYTASEVSSIQHYIIGYSESDGTFHPANVGAARSWLGLGASAYVAETLDSVSARSNQIDRDINFGSYNELGIKWAYNGDYAKLFYSNALGNGNGRLYLDISDDNLATQGFHIRGKRYDGVVADTAYFSANGSTTFYGGVQALSNLDVKGGSALVCFDGTNSYGARVDTRGATLHQYVWRASDGAALPWSENWFNGSRYFSWSTDSTGFYADAKITAVSSGSGSDTYAGALETKGVNAGITFHYPGSYAAPLWMGSGGNLNWSGNGLYVLNSIESTGIIKAATNITAGNDVSALHVYGNNFVAGTRVYSGFDSGVAGSVSASNWFRSNGASGWFSSDYGGGIYMSDSTWVRIYGSKAFWVDNTIRGVDVVATNNFFTNNYGGGFVGVYDSTKYQAVFSMGAAYVPALDGTSLNNSYGIVWTHSNVGGQSKSGLGHQALFTEAGVTQTAIGNGIWTRANIYAAGQVEAPAMKANDRMIIPTIAPVAPVSGCIWIS